MIPRLKAGFFVRALIRRVEVAGAQAYVVRKGSEEAGAVFLKISRLDGTCTVLNRAWTARASASGCARSARGAEEAKAAQYLERQVKFDPDIWIVEIEDRQGRTFVDEKVV